MLSFQADTSVTNIPIGVLPPPLQKGHSLKSECPFFLRDRKIKLKRVRRSENGTANSGRTDVRFGQTTNFVNANGFVESRLRDLIVVGFVRSVKIDSTSSTKESYSVNAFNRQERSGRTNVGIDLADVHLAIEDEFGIVL